MPDPDDWFAEDDLAAPATWNVPDLPASARPVGPSVGGDGGFTVTLGTLLAAGAAVAAVAAVVVGLILAGVFSSGSTGTHTPTTPTTTIGTTTTTQTPTTTPTPTVPAPTATLKPGDTGAQVKRLQRALARLGYPVGKVDGDYGPSTKAALERFQKHASLTADGVLGSKSLAALKRALAATG